MDNRISALATWENGRGVLGLSLAQPIRKQMAGATGLEPAASAVTGQRSNQLSYAPNQRRKRLPQSNPKSQRENWTNLPALLQSFATRWKKAPSAALLPSLESADFLSCCGRHSCVGKKHSRSLRCVLCRANANAFGFAGGGVGRL